MRAPRWAFEAVPVELAGRHRLAVLGHDVEVELAVLRFFDAIRRRVLAHAHEALDAALGVRVAGVALRPKHVLAVAGDELEVGLAVEADERLEAGGASVELRFGSAAASS